MWTSRNRARYDRSKLRYPSDVTDEEWELMVPLIPPGKSGGGKRTVIMREVANAARLAKKYNEKWGSRGDERGSVRRINIGEFGRPLFS